MVNVYIALGSNLGNKSENLELAIGQLMDKCELINESSWYETEPVGFEEQDHFLNCVVKIETNLSVTQLLAFCKQIEISLGRVNMIKNGPRIIDLDILFYDDLIVDSEELKIPHPQMHKRRFVLEPLVEIDPNFIHPILKKPIKDLLDDLKDDHECTKVI